MDESHLNRENQMPQRILEGSNLSFGEDRISKLHDSLVSYILSFVSTKSAVRTSSLSRRWKNVWKCVPKLQVNSGNFMDEDEFVDFVDRAMEIHSGSRLQKFRLKYDLEDLDYSRFEVWFRNLVDCKVEHVDVINCLLERIPIPGSICNCNTLVVLELYYVSLKVPELVSLPCLKILNIREVEFKNASAFRAFISGCPVLEEAYITRNHRDNLDVFHLSSQSLKKLCIFRMEVHFSNHERVVIEAPNLKYLCLAGQPFEILTTNVSASLVEADIDVFVKISTLPGEFHGNAANLSAAISGAKSLTLSTATLYFFVANDLQPAFANLIYLDIEFPGTAWQLLPAFVANSPKLKTLIIGGASTLLGRFKLVLPDKPHCLSTSLQYFELRGSVAGRPIEVSLVKYFLKNSRVLKKVTIHVDRDFQLRRRKLSLFLKRLRTFQRRCKRRCRIMIVRDKRRFMFPEYKKGKFNVWDN